LLKPTLRAYCGRLSAAAAGRQSATSVQRARLLQEQADAAALKNAIQCGEMLPAAEVEAGWSTILKSVRDRLLALPSRVAARLPILTKHDVSEIDHEVRAVLTEAAGAGE
jgi:phage terminase Nu1 subunit (DNA packaging protein)